MPPNYASTHRHSDLVLACALLLCACTRENAPTQPTAELAKPATPTLAASAGAAPIVHHGFAWYHDDAATALAQAKAEHKPVLVDLWARGVTPAFR